MWRVCLYHDSIYTITSQKPCRILGYGVCRLEENKMCPKANYTYSDNTYENNKK